MNAYIVATLERYRAPAIETLRRVDPKAVIRPHDNPCLFSAATKVSSLTLECVDGVSHVIYVGDVQ